VHRQDEVSTLREEVRLLETDKAMLEIEVDRLEDDLIHERTSAL